jgi:hypothetical protein
MRNPFVRRTGALDSSAAVTPPPVDYDVTFLGLNQGYWNDIARAVVAAHRGDAPAFLDAMRRREATALHTPGSGFGVYLYVILQTRVVLTFDRIPTTWELESQAATLYPRYHALLSRSPVMSNLSVLTLEKTLMAAVEPGDFPPDIRGTRWNLAAAAASGILMDDPQLDLFNTRRIVAQHWEQRGQRYREPGLI